MAENDLNNTQVVTEQEDLNKADSVDQQDLNSDSVNQEQQDGKLADGTDANKTVKYSELKKATDRAKVAEDQASYAQRQLELLQVSATARPEQAGSTFEQALSDLGFTADDYYGENIIKVQNRKSQLDAAAQQQQMSTSANMQFVNSHPDFAQVVGSVNPATGQIISLSQEALILLQKKPYLANASYQAAYDEVLQARKFAEFESKATVNQEHLNRQGADNVSQPLGGSAAGGGGASDPNNQQMMTRDQQLEIRRKVANGEEIT